VPLAGDAEPGHSVLTEPAEPGPHGRAEAAAFAVDQTVHHDIERDHQTHWSGETESQESAGEDSANEDGPALPEPGTIMPTAPTEDLSHPAPEAAVAAVAAVGDDTALASQDVPLAGDADAEPGHSALTEPAAPGPHGRADAGAFAVDQTVHHDIERDRETCWSGEPERQYAADAVVRPDGDDVGPLVEAEPSRALLPESQLAVGPEEDPGDLFEPMANPPFAPPLEAVAPVVAPAPPSDLASNPEHTRAPSSEREPECGEDAQAAMSAPEAEGLDEVSSVDTAALALPPSAALEAKPLPQAPSPQPRVAAAPAAQAVPRSAPSDPLAPVRALSEEEMIALFS